MTETTSTGSSLDLYEQFARIGKALASARQALEILRAHGLRARRLEDGFPEWRLAGLPAAVGAEER